MRNLGDYIINRLYKLVEQKGMSAQAFCIAAGFDKSYLSVLKSKNSLPSHDALFQICEYCHITLSDFFKDYYKSSVSAEYITKEIERLVPEEEREACLEMLQTVTSSQMKALLDFYKSVKNKTS